MASSFGVSVEFIDKELSNFIYAGKLSCKIDKVNNVIESNIVTGDIGGILTYSRGISIYNNIFYTSTPGQDIGIFIGGGGAHQIDPPPAQGRLQYIAGVHGPVAALAGLVALALALRIALAVGLLAVLTILSVLTVLAVLAGLLAVVLLSGFGGGVSCGRFWK